MIKLTAKAALRHSVVEGRIAVNNHGAEASG
jgi:hypothetical protein